MQLSDLVAESIKTFNRCVHCDIPMRIGQGQLAYFHKECRLDGRRAMEKTRKAGRKEEVRLHNEAFDLAN